jgi:MmyB-like transcription regulator ligand binding domain
MVVPDGTISSMRSGTSSGRSAARWKPLDPSATQFCIDWERQAQDTVVMLRTEAGRSPHDRALPGLIGELSTRSEIFRTWWAAHNVRFHRTGVKRLHHPVVGDLSLTFEAMDLAADEGMRISAYTAEPGSARFTWAVGRPGDAVLTGYTRRGSHVCLIRATPAGAGGGAEDKSGSALT